MSERKTEGKDHKEDDDEDDLEEPDLKVRESWGMGNEPIVVLHHLSLLQSLLQHYALSIIHILYQGTRVSGAWYMVPGAHYQGTRISGAWYLVPGTHNSSRHVEPSDICIILRVFTQDITGRLELRPAKK